MSAPSFTLYGKRERAPLIVETEYFPRPGYDGYCLMGRDEPTLIINHPGKLFIKIFFVKFRHERKKV